jgi:hypothetical protein
MNKIKLTMLCALMIFAANGAMAQKKKKKGAEATPAPTEKPASSNGMKPYSTIITKEAETSKGMMTVHKVGAKHFFEIADTLLGREILVVSIIAGTVENFNFGGAGMKARNQQVWRWEKKDSKLLLRYVSYSNVASPDEPIYQSVRNNNFEPIVMTFDIKTMKADSSAWVIEVDDLFITDIPMIGPLNEGQRKEFQIKGIDKNRSMIMSARSFPTNTEVRHILTYNAGNPPANGNTQTLSIEMNQSMVLLPKIPMTPRMYDDRVGYFSINQTDYGLDEQKATSRKYITRWRLEPSDEEAYKRGELVEPKKQIVYYIDPATPVKWRKYLKQGVEDWQVAFEAAGFKNAIIAKDAPTKEEDPDWSPEDARFSVIRYTANPIQNAMGPHVHDPRSGEIIESDIIWYHNVMNLLRNWYFVQTAAVNPDARKVKFDDEVMGRLIRFVSAHEVGHTLGFPHNMGSSHAYAVDSLRSKTFTEKMGTAPSIMDYARFNYIAQPGDNAALFPEVGPYDKWAAKWGYTWLPDVNNTIDEKETLNQWILEHRDQIYWYGRQQGNPIDPRSQTEDLGDDAMKASSYGIANLKRIVPNLVEWSKEDGKNYDDLQELYLQVLGQWNRYNGHVKSNIGGIYQTYKTYEEEGSVYEFVPKATQKRAMDWIQKETFATPKWMMDENVLSKIEGAGAVERIRNYQVATLNQILDGARVARMIAAEASLGNKTYTPMEMMGDIRKGIWSELNAGGSIDTYRRNLQRAHVERLGELMKADKVNIGGGDRAYYNAGSINISQSDVQAMVRSELKTLKSQVVASRARFGDTMSRIHLEDAIERIDAILDPK